MANIKANVKTIRKSKKRYTAHKAIKSSFKSQNKKTRALGKKEDLARLYKELDSAVSKKIITKNKANRIKAKAAKQVNKSVRWKATIVAAKKPTAKKTTKKVEKK